MDTPQLLLEHHLKTLRLPTFHREYDKVAQQCAAEGVEHSRYLLRLAELELLSVSSGQRSGGWADILVGVSIVLRRKT